MNGKQLKNSILQWAIQGKLVPQDPNDEPASVLLERIRAEKKSLIKEGKIKKDKNESIIYRGDDNSYYEKFADGRVVCIDDEIPFDIPQSWEWTRLKNMFSLQAGKNITSSEIKSSADDLFKYPCFGGNGLRGYVRRYNNKGIKPLIGRQGALCGNLNMSYGQFYATEHAVVVDSFGDEINVDWSYYFLTALNLNQYATATAQPGLAVSKIIECLIPVPPRSEQNRIVAKIRLLIPCLERFQYAQDKLDTLNEDINNRLKKSILQEAIQGHLTPQNPSDEPVSVLLYRIQEEKKRLLKDGKIKQRDLAESVIYKAEDNKYYEKIDGKVLDINDEIPYDIPASWSWVRLQQVCTYIHRGKSPKYSEVKKFPVIAQKCNQWDGFHIEKAQFIAPESVSSYAVENLLRDKDLLWNSTGLGTLGRIGLYPVSSNPYGFAVADSHVTVIRTLPDFIRPEFLLMFFSSPTVQSVIEDKASGSTKQKELATETVKSYIVPIPPLAEQDRILDKYKTVLASWS